jgi:hypothetical protein
MKTGDELVDAIKELNANILILKDVLDNIKENTASSLGLLKKTEENTRS